VGAPKQMHSKGATAETPLLTSQLPGLSGPLRAPERAGLAGKSTSCFSKVIKMPSVDPGSTN